MTTPSKDLPTDKNGNVIVKIAQVKPWANKATPSDNLKGSGQSLVEAYKDASSKGIDELRAKIVDILDDLRFQAVCAGKMGLELGDNHIETRADKLLALIATITEEAKQGDSDSRSDIATDGGNQVGKRSGSIEDMLWAITELPTYTSVYKGKNYWTASLKLSYGGYLKVRNKRLSDCLVNFVDEHEYLIRVNDLKLDGSDTKSRQAKSQSKTKGD